MTIEPASPEPPKRDLVAQIRLGTIAFLCVCILIAWVVAGNYDPSKSPPAKKDGPAQPLATEFASLDEDTPLPPTATGSAPLEQDTPLPPLATDPVLVEQGTPFQPVATNPVPTLPVPTLPVPAGPTIESNQDDPIPAGTPADVGDGLLLTIMAAIRPADAIVSASDPFTLPPGPDQEFLLVEIRLTCDKPSNETCYFSTFELKAVGEDGFVSEAEIFIMGIDDLLEDGEYLGGSTLTGKVFFIVARNDPTLVLYHESLIFGDIIYLALP